MKFNPGDPVWANSKGTVMPAGEHAGVVTEMVYCPNYGEDVTSVCIPAFPTESGLGRLFYTVNVRPRRDDYQQHEDLGSMDDITKPIDLTEASVEELCEYIFSEVESSGSKIRRF